MLRHIETLENIGEVQLLPRYTVLYQLLTPEWTFHSKLWQCLSKIVVKQGYEHSLFSLDNLFVESAFPMMHFPVLGCACKLHNKYYVHGFEHAAEKQRMPKE